MDTSSPSGELLFHVFGALAQFERSLIQERVNAGLAAAKKRGRVGGRPRAIPQEKMDAILEALNNGMSKAAICRTFEVKRSTLIDIKLKSIYDVFDLQVLFSGSSALRLEHAQGDLSRRAVVHYLGVLSLREFIEIETKEVFPRYTLKDILEHHYDIAVNIMSRIRPLEQFSNYLDHGCYPFYQESLNDYPQKLLEVISLTVDVDLCGIYNIDPSKTR
jgi:hypothetical protein